MSVREYREFVEGEAWPSYAVWERIEEFSGWPRAYVGSGPAGKGPYAPSPAPSV